MAGSGLASRRTSPASSNADSRFVVAAQHNREIIELLGEDRPIGYRFSALLYDMWIGYVYETFNQDNVLVLNFAELIRDPEAILRRAARFIGIEAVNARSLVQENELNKHASRKVFRLNEESKSVIRDRFHSHNESLRTLTGVDLNKSMV